MAGDGPLDWLASPTPIVIRVEMLFFLSVLVTAGSHLLEVTLPMTRMLSGSLMLDTALLGEFWIVLMSPIKSEVPLLKRLF